MNFVRNLFATPAKTPPKLEADFYKYENGQWTAVGNETAVVTFIADSFSIELDEDEIHMTFPVRKISQPLRTIDDEGGVNIQWVERKNDSVAEFGLRFTDREMAEEFWRKFSRSAQEESEVLAQAEIDFLVFNGKDWAKVQDLEDVFATASQRPDFEAFLTFSDVEQTRVVLNLPVNHQLNMGKNDNDTCLSFACADGVYMMRFRSRSDYGKFSSVLDRMLAERAARTRVDLDVVMQSLDPEDDEDDEEEEDQESDDDDLFDDCEEFEGSPVKSRRGKARQRARFLQCGKLVDRAFVCQEVDGVSEIQVHKIGGSQTPVSIRNLKAGREAITPSKGLLHQGDSTLLLIDQQSDKVHHMDLETEKVVKTYNADSQKVMDIFPVTKFAQAENEQTFLGMNGKATFVMDPRQGGNSHRVRSYEYSSNPQLSCMASDAKGHFVVGSRIGEFRLFDGEKGGKEGTIKKAKTLLQGFGDAVTHVDVTSDGQWILGTTDTYLILLEAKLGGGETAFQKPMPAANRPKPIRLQLKVEDIASLGLDGAKFTPAKFEAVDGKRETKIVTSMGSVAVEWDIAKVRRARSEKGKNGATYKLSRTEDFIVATDIFTKGKNVVCAFDGGVQVLGGKR
jgi:hypothetical protein